MSLTRWKVTLIIDIEEGSHPRKFVPESITEGLRVGEDLVDYYFEEVPSDFSYPN